MKELLRQGYWNEEAADIWLKQADAAMFYGIDFHGDVVDTISPITWERLPLVEMIVCGDTSESLVVFMRK